MKRVKQNLNSQLLRLAIIVTIILMSFSNLFSQTMYDSWKRSQTRWHSDLGISFGPASGLQFQYFNTRRNTCKTLVKNKAIDFGLYYEGLIFGNDLKTKIDKWEKGGYRAELAFLFYPNIQITGNRFFIGGGVESGSRKIDGEQLFQSDFIAKFGWELSLISFTGLPIVIRTSLKYNKCMNNNFTYLLPTVGLIYGK